MDQVTKWFVGGCLRDERMGIPTKDIDFAIENVNFDEMRELLIREGFTIHTETPEHFTIRCGVPKDNPLFETAKDADFVMCRKDAPTGDGRRPDFVEPGTIFEDLARRDFTVNAIARNMTTGEVLDPHNGIEDIDNMQLRFVGDPFARIKEDGLRVLRGFRFIVTKGFTPTPETLAALLSPEATEAVANPKVSVDRIRTEVNKMMSKDTIQTLNILCHLMGPEMLEIIFRDGLRLKATTERF